MSKRSERKRLADVAKEGLGTPEEPYSTPPQKVDKTIEISERDFQGLLSTIESLNQRLTNFEGSQKDLNLPVSKVKRARVHYYKGQPVVRVGKAWELKNADGRGGAQMRLEVFTADDKLHEVNLKDFRDDVSDSGFTSKELVIKEIVTLDAGEKSYGMTEKVEVDYDKFRSVSVGRVPLLVVTPKHLYVMADDDGTEVEVDPLALN